eukprot:scaffold49574_cov39-Phaeocystis_antarctica.AAC.2
MPEEAHTASYRSPRAFALFGAHTVARHVHRCAPHASLAFVKVVSATSYRPWRRAALIVPRPRWKPSDLPPTQAPVGGMPHWHAQAARSTA